MNQIHTIRKEPDIQQLLSRMPASVGESLSDEQLMHLKTAIGSRNWGETRHRLPGHIPDPIHSLALLLRVFNGAKSSLPIRPGATHFRFNDILIHRRFYFIFHAHGRTGFVSTEIFRGYRFTAGIFFRHLGCL